MNEAPEAATLLKMSVGGITVDFAAMIEEVVANNNGDAQEQEASQSPDSQSQGVGQTPEVPATE
jgi:hypothetical protein